MRYRLLLAVCGSLLFGSIHLSRAQEYQPDSNTVGLWHLNELFGDSVYDASGNNNGNAVGAAITSGKFGEARSFDGNSDYVVVPNSASLEITSGITLEAWVNLDNNSFSNIAGVLSKGGFDLDRGYELLVQGMYVQFALRINQDLAVNDMRTPLTPGIWYHLAATYDGTYMKIYVNGICDTTYHVPVPSPISPGTDSLFIGKRTEGNNFVAHFPGRIDEVRISNIARQPSEFNYRRLAPLIIVPGIMGSGLFNSIDDDLTEPERVWIPAGGAVPFWDLLLDGNGASDSPHIKVGPIRGNSTITLESDLDYDVLFWRGPLAYMKTAVESLTRAGYTLDHYKVDYSQGDNLFVFPYDWRLNIDTLALRFSSFVDWVRQKTSSSKLDIIAYSMGTVVVRKCIAGSNSERFRKIVFCGGPHQGSVMPAKTLSCGSLGELGPFPYAGKLNLILLNPVAFQLANNMLPLYQMLPTRRYTEHNRWLLVDQTSSSACVSLGYDESIQWLKNLQIIPGTNYFNKHLIDVAEGTKSSLVDLDFSGIDVFNVGCETQRTPSQVIWLDNALRLPALGAFGDGTVPTASWKDMSIGNALSSKTKPYDYVDHGDLLSDPRVLSDIISFINGTFSEQGTRSVSSDANVEASSPEIQVNISGARVFNLFDRSGLHTGSITDSTWDENIPQSSVTPSFDASGKSVFSIVLPKDSIYYVDFKPSTDTVSVDYSVYDLSSGELLEGSFFDSLHLSPNSAVLCTIRVNQSVPSVWIDANADGLGDSTISNVKTVAQATEVVLGGNWNLVSLPRRASTGQVSTLFPSAKSPAFSYFDGYQARDSMEMGVGYWLKCSANSTARIVGTSVEAETVSVRQGWNLIGSIAEPVAASSITSDPPSMVTSRFFGYSGSYVRSDSIKPGHAYWVKASQDGFLFLCSSPSPANMDRIIRCLPTDELPPSPPDVTQSNRKPLNPDRFSLAQNYPNPFNPMTWLHYALQSHSQVRLEIFNTLGEKVCNLVSTQQAAGSYEEVWDASGFPSGVYFCRLIATPLAGGPAFNETKELLLVR